MLNPSSPFSNAVLLIAVSVVLHLVVIAVSGGGFVGPMLAGALIWAVVAVGLNRGWRWLAYIAFLLALVGGMVAMANAQSTFGLTSLTFWGIVAMDWLAAVALFVAIWRDPVRPEPAA